MKYFSTFRLIIGGVALGAAFMLSACSSNELSETEAFQKEKSAEGLAEASETDASKEKENTSSNANSTDGNGEAASNLPKYLPEDFPLPSDAEISHIHSEQTDGKKYVYFRIRSKESMDSVTSMYTNYFEKRKLEDAAQTIDQRNIIIQGESPTYSEYWSMIGGALTDSGGVIELTVSWEEL
ncbi:hypothetical protein PGH26_13095 [Sporosarcina jeotgali]|uniref:Lipoprotein n=1 Tax=Sporosarcina jeotgali TaxID=3020056 RepID=A0ABZ0KWJ5_9BACL|nr:hypothetical protein [Sporosarcina sp. B2O-1]WOV83801.1 hypothetical protein PGH26_13095 [Sporosarcina sp. B2O-1]